jgi:sugar phosphate isomerase/epimerase
VTTQLRVNCSLLTLVSLGDVARRVAELPAHGFDGLELWIDPQRDLGSLAARAQDAGLAIGAGAHFAVDADPAPIFAAAAAMGADYLEAQVDGYWLEDDEILERWADLDELGRQHGVPFRLETHRGRVTQDLRRTARLSDRAPERRFCGDFGHYVVAGELVAPLALKSEAALVSLAARCVMLHLRVSAGQSGQDRFEDLADDQRALFRRLWRTAYAAALERSDRDFVATTEVVGFGYMAGRTPFDLWAETLTLAREARSLTEAAPAMAP